MVCSKGIVKFEIRKSISLFDLNMWKNYYQTDFWMMRKSVLFCYITLILAHCTKNNCDFSAKIQKIFSILKFYFISATIRSESRTSPAQQAQKLEEAVKSCNM